MIKDNGGEAHKPANMIATIRTKPARNVAWNTSIVLLFIVLFLGVYTLGQKIVGVIGVYTSVQKYLAHRGHGPLLLTTNRIQPIL